MKGYFAHALRALRRHAGILGSSGLIGLGSVLAAGLGFVYWWFAARAFPPAAVGAQAALISTMALVGMLGDAGFGTMLLAEIGNPKRDGQSLLAAAALAGSVIALVLAILTAGLFYGERWMTWTDAILFIIGSGLTGLGMVVDAGFIGLGQSRLQFGRTLVFSVAKLILLIAVGLLTKAGAAILLTWVVSLALSLALSCGQAVKRGTFRLVRPDVLGLAREIRVVIDHHLLNLSSTASGLLLPLVVSFCLGPAVNAAFYASWMVRTLLMLVPLSLTTVLFTLDRGAPEIMRQRLLFSLVLSLGFSFIAFVGFMLFGGLMLRIFNVSYPALAGAAMPMLGFSLIGGTVRQHYILLARIRNTMRAGSFWLAIGGGFEIGLAALGGLFGNLHWLALGWVLAVSASAAFLARPLLAYVRPPRRLSPIGAAVSSVSHQ
jgi:O-antigen/teichoic acid export membrane protein